MLPLQARVDQGVMAMKGYSAFLKALALLKPCHQIDSVKNRTFVGRVLVWADCAIKELDIIGWIKNREKKKKRRKLAKYSKWHCQLIFILFLGYCYWITLWKKENLKMEFKTVWIMQIFPVVQKIWNLKCKSRHFAPKMWNHWSNQSKKKKISVISSPFLYFKSNFDET